MQNTMKKFMGLTLAGLTLSGLSLARTASAQDAGTAPAPGNGVGRGGQGRQRGGFMGNMPFAMGTITGGDAANHTITIKSQMTNASQTIQLSVATPIYTQTTVTVADLRVNDKVKVSGIPSAITADTITVGDIPDFLQSNNRGRPGGTAPANPAAPDPNAPDDPNATPTTTLLKSQASATATGKVIATSPLTIELSKDVTVVLKLAPKSKITRIAALPYRNLNLGDKVFAAGQANPDGTFAATGIGINMDASSGLGMPGRGFGGGGFPGGGPGGAGGVGGQGGGGFGGRGGRRNRGGNAGNGSSGN